jgi:serine/threonine protein phosphatase PrpC
MSAEVRYTTAQITHEGCVRKNNEDSHLSRDDIGLWVVADGMGGHDDGEVASAAIVQALADLSLEDDFSAHLQQISAMLSTANEAILNAAEAAGSRMGSTAAVLHIDGMQYGCVWVGDSRIYRLRNGELTRLTHDHTQVQEMLERGLLTPDEAKSHPMSHVLSRAVGVERKLRADTVSGPLEPRDIFLLCSDGLTGLVPDAEIAQHLANGGRGACQLLLDLALDRGAPDNVTIVTVSCEEKTALILERET